MLLSSINTQHNESAPNTRFGRTRENYTLAQWIVAHGHMLTPLQNNPEFALRCARSPPEFFFGPTKDLLREVALQLRAAWIREAAHSTESSAGLVLERGKCSSH